MSGLSTTAVLALHGLHLLLQKRKPATLGEIRRSGGFPAGRVREVMLKLRDAGLVERRSTRGYTLAKAPGEIRILDILRAVEAPPAPEAPCEGDYDACLTRATCVLAPLCRRADEARRETLRNFTLEELEGVGVELPNCLDPKLRNRAS